MNLCKKFVKWLNTDNIEESWKKRTFRLTKVTLEFQDGEKRELSGEAADEWAKDLHYRNCGRTVDWKRHKWQTIKKS